MSEPRKRKTIGERIAERYPHADDYMMRIEIDRAVAAHVRKVCKPLVLVLKCTSSCGACPRCTELARTALAEYKEISK
jgi:hypothetical protein